MLPSPTLLLLATLAAVGRPPAAPAVGAPADSLDRLMGPGVSQELAAYRAERLRDVRYDLRLDVTSRDTATGHVTVRFTRVGEGDVVLDFRGLRLAGALANGRPIAGLIANGAHVRVPARALRAGTNRLDFDFAAAIAPSGASVIRYHDATDGADYLYTLLVPADANQLFPCFDQPDLKARVTLSLVAPRGWSAVANGALLSAPSASAPSASAASDAATTFRFAETRPISTYLIAFAAGPWTRVTASPDGRPLTMYVRRSRAAEAEADSLIAANARALRWLERYFDQPYPFGKYDFVLAPAFPFGGMEHPGAVFYNEERFIFRERPTVTQRLGRTATIYHEVAHQWFGDLVTMRWFDDLWLKEGFATYMAAKMQAAIDPGSNAWQTFYLRNKPQAYGVDATAGTTPVWQRLANLDQAKSNYGAIVYNKAPSVLKQLDYLVGDDAFRRGVRRFLRAHRYGNATWRDLLQAIGAAAGRPLAPWGEQYILRPGMPVVEQSLSAGGDTLRLVQRPAQALSGGGVWPMRTEVLAAYEGSAEHSFGGGDGTESDKVPGGGAPPVGHRARRSRSAATRLPVEITAETTYVRLDRPGRPAYVYANAGDQAYALVLPDSASVRWLETNIGTVDEPLRRAMLWGSLWEMVREARLSPERYLAVVMRELPSERDEQIVAAVLTRVTRAAQAYLSPPQRDVAVPHLERTLQATVADTARPYGIRKASLDALIAVARTPQALRALDALLDSTHAAGEPSRGPTRWAIIATLLERGVPSAERRYADEARRDSTSEGRRRAFVAGAARPDSATKHAYFTRYFADTALNEEWVSASLDAFSSPGAEEVTRPYLRPALDTIPWIQRNRRIFFLGAWLDAFLSGQTSPAALGIVDEFLRTHPALPRDLREKVLQSADELRRTVAIRRTFGPAPSTD
jgi:aminopeptidase N